MTPTDKTYPISYGSMCAREELRDLLNCNFDTATFLTFWGLTNQMTLDGVNSINEAISDEFARSLADKNIDYREIIWSAFYDRAYMIRKYTDEISSDKTMRGYIFNGSSFLSDAGAETLLRKLGYLDAVFCRNNAHLARVSQKMQGGTISLYDRVR